MVRLNRSQCHWSSGVSPHYNPGCMGARHLTRCYYWWFKTSGRPVDMVNIPQLSESLSCIYYVYIYIYDICISTGDRRISLHCRGSHSRREFFLENPLNHKGSWTVTRGRWLWMVYIGDCTTQVHRDCSKSWNEDPYEPIRIILMECHKDQVNVAQLKCVYQWLVIGDGWSRHKLGKFIRGRALL